MIYLDFWILVRFNNKNSYINKKTIFLLVGQMLIKFKCHTYIKSERVYVFLMFLNHHKHKSHKILYYI